MVKVRGWVMGFYEAVQRARRGIEGRDHSLSGDAK